MQIMKVNLSINQPNNDHKPIWVNNQRAHFWNFPFTDANEDETNRLNNPTLWECTLSHRKFRLAHERIVVYLISCFKIELMSFEGRNPNDCLHSDQNESGSWQTQNIIKLHVKWHSAWLTNKIEIRQPGSVFDLCLLL